MTEEEMLSEIVDMDSYDDFTPSERKVLAKRKWITSLLLKILNNADKQEFIDIVSGKSSLKTTLSTYMKDERKGLVTVDISLFKNNEDKSSYYQLVKELCTDKFKKHQQSIGYRGIPHTLSLDEFSKIIRSRCDYCGALPAYSHIRSKGGGTLYFSGIDRVVPRLGYTSGNCVPCCKICNTLKNSASRTEFFTRACAKYFSGTTSDRNSYRNVVDHQIEKGNLFTF